MTRGRVRSTARATENVERSLKERERVDLGAVEMGWVVPLREA